MCQRKTRISRKQPPVEQRKGSIAILTAILLVPLMALIALAIDYGHLQAVRADLQRAADAAVLAAVQDLAPDKQGNQNDYAAKDTLISYVQQNVTNAPNFTVSDSDIVVGVYNPFQATVSPNGGALLNAVTVTLRRESGVNGEVSLFFARVIGIQSAPLQVTATAYLPPARLIHPGAGILPFSIPISTWVSQGVGDEWSIYGDGKLTNNNGQEVPGNWGTLDIGSSNNSTADLRDQITDGLRQSDLDALYAEGRIPSNQHIDAAEAFNANGDPGLSSGIKSAVEQVEGMTKLIPIFDSVSGNGANVEFHVVGWGAVEVVDSSWGGAKNTYVRIKKSYLYDGHLSAPSDLTNPGGIAENAYGSAVLVK